MEKQKLQNLIISKNTYSYDGKKLISIDNSVKYDNLTQLYSILNKRITNREFSNSSKHQLPYLMTTSLKYGMLAGQTGTLNYLFLDIDGEINRNEVEKIFAEYEYISYFSYSNGLKDGDRFRIIIALDRSYTSEELKIMKNELSSLFPYADKNSFKRNTLMYAPVFYDNKRDPKLKYNNGDVYSLEDVLKKATLINEISSSDRDNELKNRKSLIINTDGGEFDKSKQQRTLNRVLSSYTGKGTGTTHDWLYAALMQLKGAGMSDNDIILTLEPYETKEHKGKVARDLKTAVVDINPYFFKRSTSNKKTILKSVISTKNDKDIYKVDEYLTELKTVIADKMKSNKRLLIEADTNIGKTFFFTHITERTLILVPTRNLVKQLVGKLRKEKIEVSAVLSGSQPDFSKELIISTYDGLSKFKKSNGEQWLKEAIVVVDEAHNLSVSSDHTFRQKAMRLIKEVTAKHYVYLTASPIETDVLMNSVYKMTVQKKVRRSKELNMIFYKDKMSTVLKQIENVDGKQIVYLNNKKELEKIQIVLNNKGLKTQLVTSDTVEDYTELILNGKTEKGVDIVLTTSILGEGFRFYEDFKALHLLSKISPELIYQMSERPENKAVETTFIYINNKSALFSLDYNSFSVKKYRELLKREGQRIIDSVNLMNNVSSNWLVDDSMSMEEEKVYNKFSGTLIKSTIEQYSEKYGNLVYNKQGKLSLNIIGINYEVYTRNTQFYWNNPALLVQKLLGYNFKMNNIIIDGEEMDRASKTEINNVAKQLKDKRQIKFEKTIDVITGKRELDDHESVDIYESQRIANKITAIQDKIDVNVEDAAEILKEIGDNNRKFNQTHKRIIMSFSYLKIREYFDVNKTYTANEINSIVNLFVRKETPYKLNVNKTKSTQIFKDIFEVKTRYKSADKTRTYNILSNNAYKNNISIDIDKNNLLRTKQSLSLSHILPF